MVCWGCRGKACLDVEFKCWTVELIVLNRIQIPDLAWTWGCHDLSGEGIIDLNNGEIWCPICRRLANVLLPVVEVSSLQRMLQVQVGDTKENHTWEQLWDPPANLSTAIDDFAVQVYPASCCRKNHLFWEYVSFFQLLIWNCNFG